MNFCRNLVFFTLLGSLLTFWQTGYSDTPESDDLIILSEELETARQQSIDQDLDELETLLQQEEEAARVQEEAKPVETKPDAEIVESFKKPEEVAAQPQAPTPVPLKGEEDGKVSLAPPEPKESPQHWALTIMGGPYRPDSYKGTGDLFDTIYDGEDWPLDKEGIWADIALEWQFFQKFGKAGLKISSGNWIIQSLHDASSDTTTDKLRYTLIATPLFGGGIYRFHIRKEQPVIPFAEAGYGGIRFQQTKGVKPDRYIEYREAYMYGVGIQVNANIFEPSAAKTFDIDWGVNRTHFVAQWRHIESVDKDRFDFTGDDLFTGGLVLEF